jgi:hypothetical protein
MSESYVKAAYDLGETIGERGHSTVWGAGGIDPQYALAALIASIATDAIASGPTWRLAWQRQESVRNWAGGLINATGTLVITRGTELADWAFPIYEPRSPPE